MEETLSHDQRRAGGMHYTTVENIHRVIDPLFLDGLKDQLNAIETTPMGEKARENRLREFQTMIASLQFLDPACGSGNFLTETFLELRRLENRILEHLLHHQGVIEFGADTDAGSLVKVSIGQMHGIEINDFAVSVAKTALWIAQQQALDATESIAGQALEHLPLHDSGNIIQANALQYDWNNLLPGSHCNYVMGNPPFIGHVARKANPTLNDDMRLIWGKDLDIDYVACWHRKAASYLHGNHGSSFAFVSTNSITQGKQPALIFKPLVSEGWRIRFAHRTFAWNAQSSDMAHVHVVIIGMDQSSDRISAPTLYSYNHISEPPTPKTANHINTYLIDGPDLFIEARSNKKGTLSPSLALVCSGSMPNDGKGNLILNTQQEYDEAVTDPVAAQYVRPFLMGEEFINGKERWCLWMQNTSMHAVLHSPFLKKRIEAVKQARLKSTRAATRDQLSQIPWLFGFIQQPSTSYVGIPSVFSEKRRWATCARLQPDVIAGNMVYTCLDPDGFMFAIFESGMFIAWQKAIGGRLKSDYRFSNTVVWNNLPLPAVAPELRERIIEAGKHIEQVRAQYPNESLASLYNALVMPPDLIKAHEQLDRLVDKAFGAEKPCHTDEERLTILFTRYKELTVDKA
jgi:hypothetical protein